MSFGFAPNESNSRSKRKKNGKNTDGRGKSGGSILFRFKPGNQAGVGHGRPRKTKLDAALEKLMERDIAEVVSVQGKVVVTPDMTVAEALAVGIVGHAMKGSAKMAQLAAERTGGKPAQNHFVLGLVGSIGHVSTLPDEELERIINGDAEAVSQ